MAMKHNIHLKAIFQLDLLSTISLEVGSKELYVWFTYPTYRILTHRNPTAVLRRVWLEFVTVDPLLEIVIRMNCSKKRNRGDGMLHLRIREMAQTPSESTKFVATIRLLKILLCQLEEGKVSTLRDIFYNDVSLFKGKQYNLNVILESVAGSFGYLLQSDLRIFPTPKGIIWSSKRTEIAIGTQKKWFLDPVDEPILISHREELEKITVSEAVEMIIIFEKEAILKSFISYVRDTTPSKALLLITGKGFPDRATVSFLKGLNNSSPHTPLMFFVDSDVYGLQIFHSYIHENQLLSKVAKLGGAFIVEKRSEWLTIGKREWTRGVKFAQRNMEYLHSTSELNANSVMNLMQRELQRGLILFKKAEINVIKDDLHSAQSVNHYLWSKIPAERHRDLT